MYPVNSTFHNLSTQDAPKTRVRVYFIGAGVDCTDDNAVQTNGTLLVGAVGDTDSNGRIGQDGITFTEMFNPDKNIQIGTAVSYQIGLTLLNTDGALNGFSYGRCKVYLDVYDEANSAWRVCPMGVFVIDIPTKRKVQLVSATGYDQMQLLDTICDSWWAGINWSGGITLSALLTSMANQLGVKVSPATASAILNSTAFFNIAPFSCVETTYREVLEHVAEVTGTVARFDRDGYLDLRFFGAAQIDGNTVTINADTVGNTCLGLDIAEYQAAAIDLLKVKIVDDDVGVTIGSGTNQYIIVNNPLLFRITEAILVNASTQIYNRLHGLGAYTPIQAKLIYDWSLEAGDIINIIRDGVTYSVPIFQQTLMWRGGYVTADILADGDNVRPVMDYDERASYRMASEMSQLGFTSRRVKKDLNTVGWKRVLTVANGYGGFVYSGVIDLTIMRAYNNTNNESHKVSLFINYNASCQFLGENSFSNMQIIDKIRYTMDGSSNGHLDIHYNSTALNSVTVDYVVHNDPERQKYTTAEGLTSVNDAPSGETVRKTYTFVANTKDNEAATKDENFSASTFSLIGYRRGDLIIYRWNINVPALTAATYYNMGTFSNIVLPADMNVTWAGQGTGQYLINFQASGLVRIYSGSATSAQFCRGLVTFPASLS